MSPATRRRLAVVSLYRRGLRVEEIAAQLGRSEGGVRREISEARARGELPRLLDVMSWYPAG